MPRPRPSRPRLVSLAWISVLGLSLAPGCGGPQRVHAPRMDEVGTGRDSSSPRSGLTGSPGPSSSTTPGPTSAPTPTPGPAPAPGVPGDDTPFPVEAFASKAADAVSDPGAAVVVLPPFHHNRLFRRFEVSQLGERLGREIEAALASRLAAGQALIPTEEFARRLARTNRSLADLVTPVDALDLAARIGASHVVRGLIASDDQGIRIDVELVDLGARRLAGESRSYSVSQPIAHQVYQELRGADGNVRLSTIRIGPLAGPDDSTLQGELQWILGLAVHRLVEEAGPALKERPLAVLPTRLPRQLQDQTIRRAMRRAIEKEKQRYISSGLSEAEAWRQGPVRVLGRTYQRLEEAEDRLEERMLDRSISREGRLSSTISRIIFDRLEDLGPDSGLKLIPHDQLIAEVLEYSGEEQERVGEGILDPALIERLKVKGARALLFNEIIQSGETFLFKLEIRKIEDLQLLTGKFEEPLAPRFAPALAGYLPKS